MSKESYKKLKGLSLKLFVSLIYVFVFFGISFSSNSRPQVAYNITQTKPMYKTWDPNVGSWSDVDYAEEVIGNEGVVYAAKIISAPPNGPRPNEKILVAMIFDSVANYGKIVGQVYDGTSWGNVTILQTFVDPGLIAPLYRMPFDAAYETATSTAIVVFQMEIT